MTESISKPIPQSAADAALDESIQFADEVVTHAKLRTVELPLGAGTAALITLDNGFDHTKPNTFGPGGLLELKHAIQQAQAEPGLAAICVIGKPFIFAVGADLTGVPRLTDRGQAVAIGKLGHEVLGMLGDSSVPTFAFVNGAAMGGGVEVALQCHYRTISSGAAAFSLPEVFLGLIPGWGGAFLLPNLIGPKKACTVIIENPLAQNRQLKPKQVFELGIADAMFEPADFLEESLLWAAKVVSGDIVVQRPDIDRGAAWDEVVAGVRAGLDARLKGATPAPYRALDLIAAAKTATRAEGFAAEDEALADLIMGEDLRAGLYSFDLVQKRAKRPVGAPDKKLARPVTKVGVVGAGLMASQMALLFAQRLQVPVVMTDLDQARVDKGLAYAHSEIDKLAAKGRLNADKANRLKGLITGSDTKDVFADADFVIEAVFEDMLVKQQVFA
ncbi:MAG: enoyl-CoA hydratase-related protein, partial [Candidatus Nanopelagicales bacterium]|nr:enoyl-CoA hydratase-related protein [Candidatus Nanopelagicales bacterium]